MTVCSSSRKDLVTTYYRQVNKVSDEKKVPNPIPFNFGIHICDIRDTQLWPYLRISEVEYNFTEQSLPGYTNNVKKKHQSAIKESYYPRLINF